MSAGGDSARCYPCHMGNHTGTNGTGGCKGRDCGCKCRKPANITFHNVTVTAKPGDAAWTPELGWHNAPEEVTGGGVTGNPPSSENDSHYHNNESETTMHTIAYTFNADIYCPACVLAEIESDPRFDGWGDCSVPPMSTEDNLCEIAHAFGFDRDNESSFDSDDFPKVVLSGQIDGTLGCGRCAAYLD